jgi:hypothetical protein
MLCTIVLAADVGSLVAVMAGPVAGRRWCGVERGQQRLDPCPSAPRKPSQEINCSVAWQRRVAGRQNVLLGREWALP